MSYKTRVLILGSSGMLGHQLYFYLKDNSNFELFDISKKNKIRNETELINVSDHFFEKYIRELRPNYIVNCIGLLVRESNFDNENAIIVNSLTPHKIFRVASDIGATLIHLSTDCVFSGKKGSYKEDDFRDGEDFYALSKILGEINNPSHLTLRTSIIGPEIRKQGEGLFHWFMTQEGIVQGYKNVIWSGVTTFELAKIIKWSIDNKLTGLHHVTNNSSINKYELLLLFQEYTQKQIKIIPYKNKVSDKSLLNTKNNLNYQIPSYEFMVKEMIKAILDKKELYLHYKI